MRKLKNNWFTLVELIIVITILAILATIAFISFQGYTKSARDWKVKSEISTVVQSLSAKEAQNPGNLNIYISWSEYKLNNLSLKWKLYDQNQYNAGILNNTALELKSDNKYLMWYIIDQWVFQVAWVLKADWDQTFISWTYSPRTQSWTYSTWTVSNKVITLGSWMWLLKIWDIVNASATTSWEIIRISSDLKTLTTSWTIADADTEFKLENPESVSLFAKSSAANTTPVTESVIPDGLE